MQIDCMNKKWKEFMKILKKNWMQFKKKKIQILNRTWKQIMETNLEKSIRSCLKHKKIIKFLFSLMRPILILWDQTFRELKLQTYVHTYLGWKMRPLNSIARIFHLYNRKFESFLKGILLFWTLCSEPSMWRYTYRISALA